MTELLHPRRRIRLRVVLSLLAGIGSCTGSPPRLTKTERMGELRKSYPCVRRPFPIDLLGRAGFQEDACSLVSLAIARIAAGDGRRFGVLPADTSRVERASALDNGEGAPRGDGKWLVAIQVRGRESSFSLAVDQRTGKVVVREDHYLQPIPGELH